MLELILDKEFLENFYLEFDSSKSLHQDFERFLDKVKSFDLICNYQSFENLYQDALQNPLLKKLLFGSSTTSIPTVQYQKDLREEIKTENFYTQGSPFKLFMIEEDCEALEKDYGFLFLKAENIDPKWQTFSSEREDLALPIDSKSEMRFDDWAKIKDFKHPFHSLLIFDRYLFALFSGNKQLASLENNLYAFFKYFLTDKEMKRPLQITILTEETKIFLDDNITKTCNVAKNRLKDFLNENFPNLNTEISVIDYDKRQQSEETEHDRGIYTNYFFIKIGKGINIFDTDNNISSRSDIEFKFVFRPTERNLASSGLRSFQEYLANKPQNPRILDTNF